MEADPRCPNCSEPVPGPEMEGVADDHAPHQRAVCPQCGATLVRDPAVDDAEWQIEQPAPPADEELGVGD